MGLRSQASPASGADGDGARAICSAGAVQGARLGDSALPIACGPDHQPALYRRLMTRPDGRAPFARAGDRYGVRLQKHRPGGSPPGLHQTLPPLLKKRRSGSKTLGLLNIVTRFGDGGDGVAVGAFRPHSGHGGGAREEQGLVGAVETFGVLVAPIGETSSRSQAIQGRPRVLRGSAVRCAVRSLADGTARELQVAEASRQNRRGRIPAS